MFPPSFLCLSLFVSLSALAPSSMMRIFNRLHKAIGLLEYFSNQDWEWKSDNMSMLMNQLTVEDRKVSCERTHARTRTYTYTLVHSHTQACPQAYLLTSFIIVVQ